jgi:hypothetical protein
LADLRGLKELHIHRTNLTDEGLAYVGKIESLEKLDLWGDPITDAGFARLADLKNLRWLGLGNTEINGEGFAHLAGSDSLESMVLDRTKVDDSGIRNLAGIRSLREVRLRQSLVTPEGLRILEKHPNLYQFKKARNPKAPEVGAIISEIQSEGRTQGYSYVDRQARDLRAKGFDLFAIIDPESEPSDSLRMVLACYNLLDQVIPVNDVAALKKLNAIAGYEDPGLPFTYLELMLEAVKSGVGFFHRAAFGSSSVRPSGRTTISTCFSCVMWARDASLSANGWTARTALL